MKKWIVLVAILAIGGLIFAASAASKDKNLTKVTTAKVAKAELISTVSCNGRIQAQKKVDISSQVMGQIVNLAVKEGDVVKKGDLLLQIDKAQYDATNRAQEASLQALYAQREADRVSREQAERDYERERKNFESKISSEQALQKARQQLETLRANELTTDRRIDQSKAQLIGSKDSLSKTTLVSPIDGIVTSRPVEAGENAIIGTMNNAGTVLLTISDMSVVEAQMEVDETDIPHVRLGQKAKLTIDAFVDEKFEGLVTEVSGSPITKSALGTDTSAVNFKVKVQIANPPKNLRPGFSVSGLIETNRRTDALAIPIPALVMADEETLKRPKKGEKPAPPSTPTPEQKSGEKKKEVEGVFVVKGGAVEFRKVKTGISADLQTEILDGLAEGDEIVTGPFKALRALRIGDKVKIDNNAPRDEAKRG